MNNTTWSEEEECLEYAVPVMTDWGFRASNIIHLVLSTIGSAFLIRVLFFRIPSVPVHINLKIVSYFFVSNLLLNCCIIIIAEIHILYISFNFIDPCHAFLPKSSYRILHSIIAWTAFAQTWFKIAFLIERSVATKKAGEYEYWGCHLGIIVAGIAMLLATVEYFYVIGCDDKVFLDREVSYVFFPKGGRTRFNHTLFFSICLSILGIIVCYFLYKYNIKEKKKKIGSRLSKRYQVSENVRATELVLCLCIITTSVFIFCLSFVLSVRLLEKLTFHDDIVAFSVARSVAYPLPLLSVLLPVSILILFNRQATGVEIMDRTAEAQEYEKILKKQWEKQNSTFGQPRKSFPRQI